MELIEASGWAAAVAAGIAAIGLIVNALSYRKNTQSRNLQIMREFASEIETLEDSSDRNSTKKEDFAVFAKKHLNLHDRIAYLAQKKIISKDLAMYFEYSFKATLGLLERDEFNDWKKDYEEYLLPWCKLQCIKFDKDALIPKYS